MTALILHILSALLSRFETLMVVYLLVGEISRFTNFKSKFIVEALILSNATFNWVVAFGGSAFSQIWKMLDLSISFRRNYIKYFRQTDNYDIISCISFMTFSFNFDYLSWNSMLYTLIFIIHFTFKDDQWREQPHFSLFISLNKLGIKWNVFC